MEPGYFYYTVPNQIVYDFNLRPGEVVRLQARYNAGLRQYVDNLNNVQYNNAGQQRLIQFSAAQIQAQGQWNQVE